MNSSIFAGCIPQYWHRCHQIHSMEGCQRGFIDNKVHHDAPRESHTFNEYRFRPGGVGQSITRCWKANPKKLTTAALHAVLKFSPKNHGFAIQALLVTKNDNWVCSGLHNPHTFSAFWLWSSVVSVLISVTTDILPTGRLLDCSYLLQGVEWLHIEACDV